MVKILWHGHACFEIRGTNVTVVTDPFKGTGLQEPSAKADIVLCSHSHGDHNNADPVKKTGGEVLEGFVGEKNIGKVNVKGIASFHDDAEGSKRGKNSIYTFNVDGLRFCHLGDLGSDLSSQDVEAVGGIDVLFVPVGGVYTIGPSLAAKVSEKLSPKIIIPMHYKMPGMSQTFNALFTIDDFINAASYTFTKRKPNFKEIDGPILDVTKEKTSKEVTVLVLSYK